MHTIQKIFPCQKYLLEGPQVPLPLQQLCQPQLFALLLALHLQNLARPRPEVDFYLRSQNDLEMANVMAVAYPHIAERPALTAQCGLLTHCREMEAQAGKHLKNTCRSKSISLAKTICPCQAGP